MKKVPQIKMRKNPRIQLSDFVFKLFRDENMNLLQIQFKLREKSMILSVDEVYEVVSKSIQSLGNELTPEARQLLARLASNLQCGLVDPNKSYKDFLRELLYRINEDAGTIMDSLRMSPSKDSATAIVKLVSTMANLKEKIDHVDEGAPVDISSEIQEYHRLICAAIVDAVSDAIQETTIEKIQKEPLFKTNPAKYLSEKLRKELFDIMVPMLEKVLNDRVSTNRTVEPAGRVV